MKLFFFLLLFSNLLFAKPFIPKDLNEVIFSIEQNDEAKNISALLEKIKKAPNNLDLVDKLLTVYIQTAKKQSDSSYMGYAKAFLVPYLKKYPNSYMLKMHLVDILQYTHKFDEALKILKGITSRTIQKTEPYLMIATIYQAKGDFNASLGACKKLIFRSSHLLSATCLTTMQSHLGKLKESYKLLEDVYAKAKKEDAHEKSWALTSLADMAYRLDKKDKALSYLKEARKLNQDDYFALKKISDIYLEQKEYLKVKRLLKPYEQVEALFLRQTLAKEKLGEEVSLEKENLKSFLYLLKLRNEVAHEEDTVYFKDLGLL